jgi:hypothetical protein
MREAIPPLPLYVFMVWCLVKESTGTNLLYFTLPYVSARFEVFTAENVEFVFSGLLRRVAWWLYTKLSEDSAASIFREVAQFNHTTWCNKPENHDFSHT